MSDVSNLDTQIVIDRRVGMRLGIGAALFFAIQLVVLGYGAAMYEGRIDALEESRTEDKPLLKQLNERTIRMEEKLVFIAKQLETPRRP